MLALSSETALMTTSVFNIGSRRRGRRRRKRSRSCRVVVAEQKAEQEDEEQEVSIPAAVEDVSIRVMIADSEHRVVTIARASMIDLMNCTKASMPRFATLEVIVLLAAPLSLFLPRLLLLMRLCCVGVCVCVAFITPAIAVSTTPGIEWQHQLTARAILRLGTT